MQVLLLQHSNKGNAKMKYAIVDFTRQTTQFFDSFAAAEEAICEYEPLCSSSVVILDITEEFPQAEQM